MEGVEFPHTGQFLSGKAAKTRIYVLTCQYLPHSVPLCVLMGNYSSVLIPDAEEFESIVSLVTEKANEPSSLLSKLESMGSILCKVNMESEKEEKNNEDEASSKETSGASLSAASGEEPCASSSGALSTLLPKALSAVLHHHTMAPGHNTDHPTSEYSATHNPPSNLEQLQSELTILRGQFEQMKAQHNKEIKLLMNELDEEKRIRLTLQMEIKRIKKHLSK